MFVRFLSRFIGAANYSSPRPEDISEKFNGWQAFRSFIFIDELRANRDASATDISEKLKTVLTSANVWIRDMFEKGRQIPSCTAVYVATNRERPLHLDTEERRWVLVKFADKAMDKDKIRQFIEWEQRGGYQEILYWAKHFEDESVAPVPEGVPEDIKRGYVEHQERAPVSEGRSELMRRSIYKPYRKYMTVLEGMVTDDEGEMTLPIVLPAFVIRKKVEVDKDVDDYGDILRGVSVYGFWRDINSQRGRNDERIQLPVSTEKNAKRVKSNLLVSSAAFDWFNDKGVIEIVDVDTKTFKWTVKWARIVNLIGAMEKEFGVDGVPFRVLRYDFDLPL